VGFHRRQGRRHQEKLFRAYVEENNDFIYWMEQQRDFKLATSFQMTHDERCSSTAPVSAGTIAPVLIVILGDGRRQWATVQGATPSGATNRTSPTASPTRR